METRVDCVKHTVLIQFKCIRLNTPRDEHNTERTQLQDFSNESSKTDQVKRTVY